jgi:hypothetical protein
MRAVNCYLRCDGDLIIELGFGFFFSFSFLFQTGSTVSKNANNSQCVAQFIGQHYTQSDLDEFFVLYDRSNMGTKPIIKGPNAPPAGVEASLVKKILCWFLC